MKKRPWLKENDEGEMFLVLKMMGNVRGFYDFADFFLKTNGINEDLINRDVFCAIEIYEGVLNLILKNHHLENMTRILANLSANIPQGFFPEMKEIETNNFLIFCQQTWEFIERLIYDIAKWNERNYDYKISFNNENQKKKIKFIKFMRNLMSHYKVSRRTPKEIAKDVSEFNEAWKIEEENLFEKMDKSNIFTYLSKNDVVEICEVIDTEKWNTKEKVDLTKISLDDNLRALDLKNEVISKEKWDLTASCTVYNSLWNPGDVSKFAEVDLWKTYIQLNSNYFLRISMYKFTLAIVNCAILLFCAEFKKIEN
ncbi:hypothetical protein [Mesoplasma lactucae]|uniref:Uncharacterized protein n=1 Tax=Mesoplasma lactucae ATCC 49193 TaxID=81460 RepID=A0A291IS72_9MOLU|nr:hypothetical protein [Mesoplasma lactucae]ATG97785.1 hypothetical protein CP520_03550 [Mesoplasma lactucae ATCC 49193]ATZ20437.1 hypothetical protein MLACT_v1c06160 [Mesoplasma lactucae ATCC 49193]MCL8216609.1 hypothetical protein [Mesoplasma lactucae ATCC 49193]